MADYAAVEELAAFLRIDDSGEDAHLGALISSASRAVDVYTGRTFDDADTSATARVFAARFTDLCYVDAIASTTDLVIKTDTTSDATFDTTWTSADYQLEPLNQRHAGLSDHPYTRIRAIETLTFPASPRALVQVTARWGFTSGVPDAVRDATMMHAGRLHSRRNAPAAIVAGDVSTARISMGLDSDVKALLAPFVRVDLWT